MKTPGRVLTILGHTAAGKTKLAAHAAAALGGEVISADSRQVYRGMDIGTGKDYEDYMVGEKQVKSHLVDIIDAGAEYNVYEFQKDFYAALDEISARDAVPVVCGGTGLYIESVLRGYRMTAVPVNQALRDKLHGKSLSELETILRGYRKLHNKTDSDTVKRAVRAIEIEEYMASHPDEEEKPGIASLTFGVRYNREERRKRITDRLHARLEERMVEEAEKLLNSGVTLEKLAYYGLEYKFLAQYISGSITYDEMVSGLNTAIHRFAKRQMTYFRGMERRGIDIHWLDGEMDFNDKVAEVISACQAFF